MLGAERLDRKKGGRPSFGLLCLGCLLLLGCGGGETSQVPPPAPAITGFSATSGTITSGATTYLTASFTGGTGVVDGGVGLITSGVPDKVGPLTADTTFLLTVTGEGGTAAQAVTVKVVPAPLMPEIATAATVMAGGTGCTASVPLQDGVSYDWTIAGGTITRGQGSAEITFSAGPPGTLQLLCVAVNAAGARSDPGTASIEVLQGPVIAAFQSGPASIAPPAAATLSWSVTGATGVSIEPGIGPVAETGSLQVRPGATTTYTLTASGQAGTATATATVTVADRPPVITGFTASPGVVHRGQSAILSWSVQGATEVDISPGIGPVPGASLTVAPDATTLYTLTATNAAGTAVASTGVLVDRWGP